MKVVTCSRASMLICTRSAMLTLRGVVSMEDVIETMTGVEIVDEDDVAVDMQALAKEKSRLMMQKKK